MRDERSIWFYTKNGDVVMVIHRIEGCMTQEDILKVIESLPDELCNQIAYFDGVKRSFIDETKNLFD